MAAALGAYDLNGTYCNLAADYVDGNTINVCEGTDKFVRTWTILDWCNPGAVTTYTQTIKVGDATAPVLDCPNDRYINDEAICQAAVGMLAQIGVTVNLDAKPKAQHFPLITNDETDFYMLGWGVPMPLSLPMIPFRVWQQRGSSSKLPVGNGIV